LIREKKECMANESRILTVTTTINGRTNGDNSAAFHPTITLSGQWLDKAGFHCGEMVKVNFIGETIVIEKIK